MKCTLLTGTSSGVIRNMPGISTRLGIHIIGNHVKMIEIVGVTISQFDLDLVNISVLPKDNTINLLYVKF